MNTNTNRPLIKATPEEDSGVSRKLIQWINKCPYVPLEVMMVKYDYLTAKAPAMALSNTQGAFITERYILGGHKSEYQFKLIYRIPPPGNDDNARLEADELLDQMATWAINNPPDLGDGMVNVQVTASTGSSMFAAYDGGEEDHQIIMKLTYEVI